MSRNLLAALSAALVAASMAAAHTNFGPNGTPKPYCENWTGDQSVHDYAPPASGVLLWGFIDGNVNDCDFDGIPRDYDGHSEFAFGGAYLLTNTTAPGGAGALSCYGEAPHHAAGSLISITGGDFFYVAADTFSPTGSPCGDFEADVGQPCAVSCVPAFGPGLDGSYLVFVTTPGTMGHVIN